MTTSEIMSAINLSIILRPITDHLDLDTGKTLALCSIMHKLYIREPHKQEPQDYEWLKTQVEEVMDLMDEQVKAEKVEEACEMKNSPCTDTEEEELRTTNEKLMKELEELRTEKEQREAKSEKLMKELEEELRTTNEKLMKELEELRTDKEQREAKSEKLMKELEEELRTEKEHYTLVRNKLGWAKRTIDAYVEDALVQREGLSSNVFKYLYQKLREIRTVANSM